MTVLGDFNQAIFAHASEMVNFDTLTSLYGPDETEVITMARSYRSTKPIIEFTRGLIAGGERIIPFDRDGEKPVLTQLSNHTELHQSITAKVAELQSLGNHSIAIICKSSKESFEAYEALSSIDEYQAFEGRFNVNMNKELWSFHHIWQKESNSMQSSFMMHRSKFIVMRAYEDYSTPPAQERCITCRYTV